MPGKKICSMNAWPRPAACCLVAARVAAATVRDGGVAASRSQVPTRAHVFHLCLQAEEAKGAVKGAADRAAVKASEAAAATKGAARDASATAKGAAGRAAGAAQGAAEGVRGAAADAGGSLAMVCLGVGQWGSDVGR